MKKEAMMYEKLDGRKVHCYLCAHNCRIAISRYGICGVRQNIDGTLYSLVYGELIAASIDPVEKKPLYHFLSGTLTYSIATIGCNFKCGYCQNWQISQASKKNGSIGAGKEYTPQQVVEEAQKSGCQSISYTYTEPVIFFEFAYDAAKLAAERGLKNIFVTNGYISPTALESITPYLDAANVDLKSFRDEYYRKICKARLAPVLEAIRRMKEAGIWVEITTLIIPGENDSGEELNQIAEFIAGLGKQTPWHLSRFFPCYSFSNYPITPIHTLKKAREIGKSHGLQNIYLGNVL
ncbi:MAG: AmmeMemoRadiSam system radical SAM enzyme [Spirochaetota bacterium]